MGPNVIVRCKYYKSEYEATKENSKLIEARRFYSSNKSNGNDYVKYADTGSKSGEVYDYTAYASNEEKSSGVFNSSGLISDEDKKILRESLRDTESVIWDLVISFEEGYGKQNIKSYEDAMHILNKELPAFFKDNRLNTDNIIWYAALHENTDNRHIHLSFFEKEPISRKAKKAGVYFHNGRITKKSLEKFKVLIEEHINSPIYSVDRHRKALIDATKASLNDTVMEQHYKLKQTLLELYRDYDKKLFNWESNDNYSVEIRKKLSEATRLLMKINPELDEAYKNTRNAIASKDIDIKRICASQKIDANPYLLATKYHEDFYRRMGNVVIKYVNNYIYRHCLKEKSYSRQRVIRNIEKGKRRKLLTNTEYLITQSEIEAFNAFEEYKRKLENAEYEINKEQDLYE